MSYNGNSEVESIYYYLNYTDSVSTYCLSLDYFYHRFPSGKIYRASISVLASTGSDSYDYDSFDRVSEKHIYMHSNANSAIFFDNDVAYSYKSNSSGSNTSGLVETYSTKVNSYDTVSYTFTYDDNGNITKILYNNGEEINYAYDDLGQLIREDNEPLYRTYVFTYDDAGNILSTKTYYLTTSSVTPTNLLSTETHGYSNSSWGDLLTSYNGTAITYDDIGNPLNYYNGVSYLFNWDGRTLTGATKGGNTYAFTYNDEGIRTSKTKNGVTTTYYLNGSQIVAEETNGNITVYAYDANGSPLGMQYRNASTSTWETYWYEKNLQGDIIAVYNEAGTKLVSYVYDAWGGAWYTSHNNGLNTKAWDNPFLYRGYYYDRDLGFYYLNSRYYDAETGRFISPDKEGVITATPDALTDKNLFAYCDNNPVMRRDDGGEFWNLIIGGVAGVIIGATVSITSQLLDTTAPAANSRQFWQHVANAAAIGAISGALAASGVGLAGQVIGNAILGAAGAIVDTAIDDVGETTASTYALRTLEGATIGSLSGLIGGKGSASKHVSNHFNRLINSKSPNFSYYFSQIGRQAVRDGKAAIPSITRAAIPTVTKTFIKVGCQQEG